jgi:hypothetical protein
MDKFEGFNSAVIKSLKVIALEYLTSIPSLSMFDYSALTILAGNDFTTIEFTHETARWSENEEFGKGGNFFKKEVFCSIPCVRNEISEEIEEFRNRRLAALVTEVNGESRLIYPLRMKYGATVQGTIAGKNGYDLNFSGEGATKSPTVTSVPGESESL